MKARIILLFVVAAVMLGAGPVYESTAAGPTNTPVSAPGQRWEYASLALGKTDGWMSVAWVSPSGEFVESNTQNDKNFMQRAYVHLSGKQPPPNTNISLTHYMNIVGEQGWETFAVVPGIDYGVICYFKRPKVAAK